MTNDLKRPFTGDFDPLDTRQLEECLKYILEQPVPRQLEELLALLEKVEKPCCKPCKAA